jgi:opacity protein-like surface antigen
MRGVFMKKLCVFLAVLLFLGATFAVSQPVPGKKFEFSTALSFASMKFSGDTESYTFLSLPLRVGYYIWKGLEFEPELILMKFEGSDAAYNLNGNLSYNFNTSGNFKPFVLAGAGFGNGVAYGPIVEGDPDLNATLLNFGGGVKYVIGTSGAIRLEYRYTHNELAEGETVNLHQVFIGVALFF